MSKPNAAATPNEELAQALDRFVASRPVDDRTRAFEAAFAAKVGRLARTLLGSEGAEVDDDVRGMMNRNTEVRRCPRPRWR